MIRLVGAALVALHGLIHLIGFVVPWRIATVDGFPYRVTTLGGLADLGELPAAREAAQRAIAIGGPGIDAYRQTAARLR